MRAEKVIMTREATGGRASGAAAQSGRLAVIIPFFQSTPGILSRALGSALRQSGIETPRVIVVDDGSPVPARTELAHLTSVEAAHVTIIQHENSGAAGARNVGLAALPQDTEFVAFLDSDDEWNTDHLRNALASLNGGFDFYFSDFLPSGREITLFTGRRLDLTRFPRLNVGIKVHHYTSDLFDALLRRSFVGLSTVAYRFGAFPDLRFRWELRNVGEDTVFCMELAQRTERIAVSAQCEVKYGVGLNVFSASRWGSAGTLARNDGERRYQRFLQHSFPLSVEQQKIVCGQITELRRAFVAILMHNFVRRHPLQLRTIFHSVALDPMIVPYLPIGLTRGLFDKMAGLRGRSDG